MNRILGFLSRIFDRSSMPQNKLPMLDFALLNYPSVWLPKWQDELDTAQADESEPAAHIRSSPGTGFWG
jgi:hypothetical protein